MLTHHMLYARAQGYTFERENIMQYFDLAVSRPPPYLPASWVGMLRVCPKSKELVPMVLLDNIGLRTAIATWWSAHEAFDVHEFLHATLTSRPSWAA